MSALEAAADAAKQVANDAFKKGDYKLAVKKYGVALKLAYELPEPKYPGKLQSTRSAQLLANRCMAHLALGDERSALTDAEQALRAAPDWPKAHFRHGTVLMRLKNYTKAYAAFKQGYHLDPTNEELTAACQQAHQKMVGLEAPKDKLLTAEELVVMRAQKVEEERRQRATLAEGRRSAAVAAATSASGCSSALAYREEALRRTVQMATGAAPEEPKSDEMTSPEAEVDEVAAAPPAAAAAEAHRSEAGLAATPVAGDGDPYDDLDTRFAIHMTSAAGIQGKNEPAPRQCEQGSVNEPAPLAPTQPPPPPPPPPVDAPGGAASGLPTPVHTVERAEDGQLVLTVQLPLLRAMSQLDLEISAHEVLLSTVDGLAYAPLTVALPARIDDAASVAKFSKKTGVLVLRMPQAGAVMSAVNGGGQVV